MTHTRYADSPPEGPIVARTKRIGGKTFSRRTAPRRSLAPVSTGGVAFKITPKHALFVEPEVGAYEPIAAPFPIEAARELCEAAFRLPRRDA